MVSSRRLRQAAYLARIYLAAIPRVAYRSTLSLVLDPRGAQTFVEDVLQAVALNGSDDAELDTRTPQELWGDDDRLTVLGPWTDGRGSSTDRLVELGTLARLVRHTHARLIVEIGTSLGRTTHVFQFNADPSCKILTLDLPPSHDHPVGVDYVNRTDLPDVWQRYGNSRTFDFSEWRGRADLAWVDGGHDYETVVVDTTNALELVRPGGYIAWHDYWRNAPWCDVTRCVREFHREGGGVTLVRWTTIAVWKKPQ